MVAYSATRSGVNPKGQYLLLGDDIAIFDKNLAASYRQVMRKLGVQINESKSITGFAGEFAKRLFLKGYEVTPIPTRMLQSTVVEPLIAKETFNIISERSITRSYLDSAQYFRIFKPFLSDEKIREMVIVCTYPRGQDVLASKTDVNALGSTEYVNP